MPADLYWLTLTALVTALMWVPYILNRIAVRGLIGATANPTPDAAPHAPWAERAILAHKNAVENLVIFAAVVLAANVAGTSGALTATAAMIVFLARIAHYAIYVAGIPFLRTLAFSAGALAQIAIALTVIGWI